MNRTSWAPAAAVAAALSMLIGFSLISHDGRVAGPPVVDPHVGTPGAGTAKPVIDLETSPGNTKPGTTPPASPTTRTSALPDDQTDHRQHREAFGFDGAFANTNPKVLIIRYGDSGTCPSMAVRQDLVQEPDRVAITLTRTAQTPESLAPATACTSDYRPVLVRIALTSPLGSRTVIDGSRQAPVPIETGTAPLR